MRPSAEMRSTLPLCLPIVVASCSAFRDDELAVGREADVLGNSRMSAVCAKALENSSWTSASPSPLVSTRRQMPLRSKTYTCSSRIASVNGSCRPEANRRQRARRSHALGREAADHPDIAVERDDDAGAVLEELDVTGADVAAPRILERQREVVHDVGVLRRSRA